MPKTQEHNPLHGVSGLKDDFIATIDSALFTYDSEYNDGKTLIALIELTADDGEDVNDLKLSTGSGWDAKDKGKRAVREDGSDARGFNRNCGYQAFIDAALSCEGVEDVLMERGGLPWEAKLWPGLRFRFVQMRYKKMSDPDDEAKWTGTRLVPAEYIADDKKTSAKGKGSGKAAALDDGEDEEESEKPAPKSKAPSSASSSSNGEVPAKVRGKMKKIAQEVESHDDFMERCYGELEDADTYEDAISDDSDEGLYAMVKAEG